MKLRSMLALPTMLMLTVVLGLVALIAGHAVLNWRQGAQAAVDMQRFQLLLTLQEKLSLERGPSNAALGADTPLPAELASRLTAARQASDRALAATQAELVSQVDAANALAGLGVRLRDARELVDQLLSGDRGARQSADISRAVSGLANLIPGLFAVVEDQAAKLAGNEPEAASLVISARTASDLREFAGLIGSQFTAPLIRRERFQKAQIDTIHLLQGRVIELHRLLEGQIRLIRATPPVDRAVVAMNQVYFDDIQHLLNDVITTGLQSGDFRLTPAEFAAAYVPAMGSILEVRDAVLKQMQAVLHGEQRKRVRRLVETGAVGLLGLLLVAVSMAVTHHRVVLPLHDVIKRVISLADGDRSEQPRSNIDIAEVAALNAALEVLRRATLDADAASARRQRLIERAATGLRGMMDSLAALERQFSLLIDSLPPFEEVLAAVGAASNKAQRGHPVSDSRAMASEAVLQASRAVSEAQKRVREVAPRLTRAMQRLRRTCASDAIAPETLIASLDAVEIEINQALRLVEHLPGQGLLAIRNATDAGQSRGDGAPPFSLLHDVLSASEQVGAACGGLAGSLGQVNARAATLSQLIEQSRPLPLPTAFRPRTSVLANIAQQKMDLVEGTRS
eukprot:gene8859-8950_t